MFSRGQDVIYLGTASFDEMDISKERRMIRRTDGYDDAYVKRNGQKQTHRVCDVVGNVCVGIVGIRNCV